MSRPDDILRAHSSQRVPAPSGPTHHRAGAGPFDHTRSVADEGALDREQDARAAEFLPRRDGDAASSSDPSEPDARGSERDDRRSLFCQLDWQKPLIGCLREPSLTAAARIYPTQWRLPSGLTEDELFHGYESAKPWSPDGMVYDHDEAPPEADNRRVTA